MMLENIRQQLVESLYRVSKIEWAIDDIYYYYGYYDGPENATAEGLSLAYREFLSLAEELKCDYPLLVNDFFSSHYEEINRLNERIPSSQRSGCMMM